MNKQKLYCYVDESGQDIKSEIFVVVAVVSDKDQDKLRQGIIKVEALSLVGIRKWHKSFPKRREQFLRLITDKRTGKNEVFFGKFKKPLPYFLPILEVLERAIKQVAKKDYSAIVYIDGIDKKKAKELTNSLRIRQIKVRLIKSRRDESEPLIRLADRWAGCIRGALLNKKEEEKLVGFGLKTGCLIKIEI